MSFIVSTSVPLTSTMLQTILLLSAAATLL